MAFIHAEALGNKNYLVTEYFPTTASETYVAGEALVLSSGALTKCGATTKPTYIACASYVAPASGNADLPVNAVLADDVFEVAFSANATSNALGTLVTIDSTGLLVTATAGSGVATIIKKLGTGNTGTLAFVRFI